MRLLGATSGDVAQGRLTEAGEIVGEVTFGGPVGFIIFVGLLFPLVVAVLYLPLRHLLPNRVWRGGLIYGAVLLATFGVADPLSPDNRDFRILAPPVLAVGLVVALGLLFGTTFTALVALLERRVPNLLDPTTWHRKVAYASLIFLIIPFIAVPAAVYVVVRAAVHGRGAAKLVGQRVRIGELAIATMVAVGSTVIITQTIREIL
jgi:hypothetical protein